MVLRNITERRWSYTFTSAAKMICVFFLVTAFCGGENTGYAQFNLLKSNNPAPTPNRTAVSGNASTQNRNTAQNKGGTQQRQNTQNVKTTQKSETQKLPQGNRNARLLEATNNLSAMKAAQETIPWNRLSNSAKEKIQSVLSSKPLYRRLPQQSAYCEPVMYDFLLMHPDVVVAIWENLGVTQISLKEHGRPGVYQLRETIGSVGVIEVLYKTQNYCIAHSKGAYSSPILHKPVEGEAILILQSVFEQDEEGEPYVVTQLDAFVNVKNFGVDVFAKMFAPVLGRIADSNFEQTIAFLGNVSEAAQTNPEVIKRLALRLEPVRKEVRDEFIQVAYQTAQLAIQRSGDSLDNPYGRHLASQQTAQTSKQRQEFDQERTQYLQNFQRIQSQQNAQRSNLPMTQVTPPTSKQPTGALVKPGSVESHTLTFEEMSPDNDFSRNLEILEKMTPAPVLSKPVPIRTPQRSGCAEASKFASCKANLEAAIAKCT